MLLNIVLISVDSPIKLGIYDNNYLTKSFELSGKIGDTLPRIFSEVLKEYEIENIFYANGPGNFSAIKLTHIFLQTLSIVKKINLFCADSFYFTNQRYINAYGKIHFFKKDNEILSTKLDEKIPNIFILPNKIDKNIFSAKCKPLYILPAI
ncbi:hypothetical protein [Helicobacter sp. MIT 14-3879]|uniref:hypothetical protein n=1 Tax=Helicobacter sp. MIT 14-3879 TaxID=2040649 RepID=UPI000E1E9CC3|nr:hypothetical protein [Helicobacter sp. MIT 14-3879]RDU65579.1 hypothetical protein CQA44_00965 [Helicobacter sp. MIT 14-3879]